MPLDRFRLLKLLQMTRSPNDAEALNAMRMANATVDRAGESWDTVLGLIRPKDPFPPPPPPAQPAGPADSEEHPFDFGREQGADPAFRPGEFLAVRIRWQILHVPLTVRVLLFPLWFTGHAVADVLEAKATVRRLLLAGIAAGGFLLSLAVWLMLLILALAGLARLRL